MDNNLFRFRGPPQLSESQKATGVVLWLHLDLVGFTPVVNAGVLNLQDRAAPPRSTTDLARNPSTARLIANVAEFGLAELAVVVEQQPGPFRPLEFDPADWDDGADPA